MEDGSAAPSISFYLPSRASFHDLSILPYTWIYFAFHVFPYHLDTGAFPCTTFLVVKPRPFITPLIVSLSYETTFPMQD